MNKLIIPLIAKRINFNGGVLYQRPDQGFKRRLFDKLMDSSFRKKHKQIKGLPLNTVKDLLADIIKEFRDENHAFVATIYSDQWNGIQIVHHYMNHDKIPGRTKDFGLSIYFTFDLSFEQVKPYHDKFLMEEFDDAKSFIHDGMVRCYDIDCGMDLEKAYSIVKRYYLETLEVGGNEQYYIEASSHGPLETVDWLK
ncbi:MAG: hypothetical protein MK105_15765 [Crocinitomicaceae bacterium]|nr:hypothetical protein [Crocinitomicaceae bacterium]